MVNDKLIDKLRKINAHAESAKKIGSEAEAQAFAAMFQKLLLDHKLQLSDIDMEKEAEQPVIEELVDYREYATKAEPIPTGRRVIWMETLAGVVARAHFCRILIFRNSTRIKLVGKKSDIEVAEFMLVTLVRTAVRLVRKEYANARREDRFADMRGFNVSFLESFIARLSERYNEQRRAAATSTSTALMRLDNADAAVQKYIDDKYKSKAARLNHSSMRNLEGHRRGRAMADRVNLSANAVKAGGSQKQLN